MEKQRLHSVKQSLGTWLDLPPDLLQNWPRINLLGRGQLHVENHKGILQYGENTIAVATSVGALEIHGSKLCLRDIGGNALVITGEITGIAYA